jgi:hypothetical protein
VDPRAPSTTRQLLLAAALTAVLQGPAFTDVYKYAPDPTVVAPALVAVSFVVVAAVLIGATRAPRVRAALGGWWLTVGLVAAVAVGSEVLFRHEQTRQRLGTGSTASQAMSETVRALLHGHGLYSVHLSGNAPVSPGPGWLLLNAPFTLLHVYALMDPAWVALAAVVVRSAYRRGFEVNLGLVLLCCSTGFLRLLGEGHDIVAIGAAMVVVVVTADRAVREPAAAVAFGVFVGVVSTARIIYLPLALLVGLLLLPRRRDVALVVAAVGVVIAAVVFGGFAVGVHPYPPLHLFGRADHRQPVAVIALGVVATLGLVGGAAVRVRDDTVSRLGWFAAVFAVPHALIGLGELISAHWAFATWEGANYVFTGVLPVLAAVLAAERWAPVGAGDDDDVGAGAAQAS